MCDTSSVESFCEQVPDCRVLVNNTVAPLGLESVAEADEAKWQWMYEANVMGVMRMTRTLLPKLIESGDGHVVTVGSIAGVEPYPGGAPRRHASTQQGAHGMPAEVDRERGFERSRSTFKQARIDPTPPGCATLRR